ncbi:MAG TPA: hypothetical protein VFS67_09430 [Polyangiaceae bacterium]|jgi:hypothetical protein|nr:hypothetical protein [Polyangiaceae bacterium]
MKEARSASGSDASRRLPRAAAVWASSCLLGWLCACSGSTDVVGVLDESSGSAQSRQPSNANAAQAQDISVSGASDDASGEARELLVVAGLPLRDYAGPSFEWPLGIPLHAFFAESSWPEHPGPPPSIERNAFARMGDSLPGGSLPERRRDDVRFVASTGLYAERLRDVFEAASAFFGTAPRSLVLRDDWGDEYLIVLGTTTTDCIMEDGIKPASHHGPCAEPNPYFKAPSFEAP